jgi:Icc-related predicted phosphoesterase
LVHGNHDCEDPEAIFSKHGITGSIKQLADDVFVVGLGWHGQYYYDLPREMDLKNVASSLARQAISHVPNGSRIIILTHYPALMPEIFRYHGNPEGWMFQSVTDLIRVLSPLMVVQGHVHELFGTACKYKLHNGETTVVNPGPRGVCAEIEGFSVRLSHLLEKS